MPLGFRGECFHEPRNHQSSDNWHKDNPGAPGVSNSMKIGIIVKLKFSEKEDIVDEPDEHAETPRAQSGNDADCKGEDAHERKVPGMSQGFCHGVNGDRRSRLQSHRASFF